MKTIHLVVVVLAMVLIGTSPSWAQGGKYPLVAYVSSQRISTESVEGKAGIARVQALQQQKATDLQARARTLETTRQVIARTSGPARETLQKQEQEQRAELERATAQAQLDLQTLQRQISTELIVHVKAVLDELLKGSDTQVVLQSEAVVIWTVPGADLTATVVERLNARSRTTAK
jgi:Skp family chaperone for outer membrane proteins